MSARHGIPGRPHVAGGDGGADAVLPGNTAVAPGLFNGPTLPPVTIVPGGAYFIGGGALLLGGAVFNGGPFTLLQFILLLDAPEIIAEEAPIDDELPSNDQPGDHVDVDQGLIVDNEAGLELSAE